MGQKRAFFPEDSDKSAREYSGIADERKKPTDGHPSA